MSPIRVIVIGAGASGLAAAFRLKARGADVLCLEASNRSGGCILTERRDGCLMEAGPNSLRDTSADLRALIGKLGIEKDRTPAAEDAKTRYLFMRGRLVPLPNGPIKFLFSPFLSLPAKLRLFCEPFISVRKSGPPETVGQFIRRRMGKGVARDLMDALVSGVYAGDQDRLEVDAAFPKFVKFEREHGSIFRGLMAAKKSGTSEFGRPLYSFRDGLSALTGALAAALGDSLRLSTRAAGMERKGGRWVVSLEGGGSAEGDAVIIATSAPDAAPLIAGLDAAAAAPLAAVPHSRLAVVSVRFAAADVPRALDGFGFLIPRREKVRILGVIWSSALYPGRAPAGSMLLTVMIGGAHDPAAVDLDDVQLREAVLRDLERTMSIRRPPESLHIRRWPRAIPHPAPGHMEKMNAVRAALAAHPGVHLIGNYFGGISVPDCVTAGLRLADSFPLKS
jgi:protoporphyrinogen/coproporphyrinogen III oxidase